MKTCVSLKSKASLLALAICAGLLPMLQMQSAAANNVVQDACQIGSSATCTWRPSVRGAVPITVSATPTGPAYAATTSSPLNIFVGKRTGPR
jgi:hypothetical protein